ncbi:MAG: hypothetical protein R3F11_13380 [Verrucomicrobiales bacterium]
MTISDIKKVLNFAAFRPEPDDSTEMWGKRFPRTRSLLINISREGVAWSTRSKSGDIVEGGELQGTFEEVAAQMGDEWKDMTDDGWCGISLNTRYVVTLETNLSRRKGGDELIRTNPKAALGARAERGKRYAVNHNPESNTSLLLACEGGGIDKIEKSLRQFELQPARIACGAYAMLIELTKRVAAARRQLLDKNPEGAGGSVVMVVCCRGSVLALHQKEERWLELRSRADLYQGEEMEPVLPILAPLMESAGAGAEILFANDDIGSGFAEYLQEQLPENRVTEVTRQNHLWSVLTDR